MNVPSPWIQITDNISVHALTLINVNVGRYEEALVLIKRAFRLNPKPPPYYFATLGLANMRLGKYAIAIETFRSVLSKEPNNMFAWMFLAICYVLTDEVDKAQKAAAEVVRLQPVFCIDLYKKIFLMSEETESVRIEIGALRKAGIPEHPPSK